MSFGRFNVWLASCSRCGVLLHVKRAGRETAPLFPLLSLTLFLSVFSHELSVLRSSLIPDHLSCRGAAGEEQRDIVKPLPTLFTRWSATMEGRGEEGRDESRREGKRIKGRRGEEKRREAMRRKRRGEERGG